MLAFAATVTVFPFEMTASLPLPGADVPDHVLPAPQFVEETEQQPKATVLVSANCVAEEKLITDEKETASAVPKAGVVLEGVAEELPVAGLVQEVPFVELARYMAEVGTQTGEDEASP